MPIDPTIPLQTKPVQFPNLLELAMQGQQLRGGVLKNRELQQSMAANTAVSQAIQNNTKPDGTVDIAGAQAELAKNPNARFNLQAATGQNLVQQGQQQSNQQTMMENARKRYEFGVSQISPLINKKDLSRKDVYGEIAVAAKTFNMSPQEITQIVADVPDTDDPAQLQQYLKQKLMSAQTAMNQLNALTPSPAAVSTGQQTVFVNTNPNAGPVGVIPGSGAIQQQLAPSTPVYNPQTGQMGYLGPQRGNPLTTAAGVQSPPPQAMQQTGGLAGQGAPSPLQSQSQRAQQEGQFIGSAPPIGVTEDVTQKISSMNADYQNLQQANQGNAQARSALSRIKTLIPQTTTGPASDKLSYANAILGEIGYEPSANSSDAYQLLIKNSNIVANAFGGNTDAARAMIEAANPSAHMTKEAISEATDEVLSNISMNDAKASYLSQFQGNRDPIGYNKAKNDFNKYADARIWQFMDMTPEERAKFKAKMSAPEQKKFANNIRMLEQMGVIQ